MTIRDTGRILEETKRSATLAKLEEMARQLTGGALHVLICKDDTVSKLLLDGQSATLPEFCRLIRATPEGLKRCSACRSLIVLRACYHGLTDYSCHGGISVLAAPALNAIASRAGEFIVVSSCAFADSDPDKGWKSAREHADGLPVNMRALQAAYRKLPVLTESKRTLARSLVDTAASVIIEINRLAMKVEMKTDPEACPREADARAKINGLLDTALEHAREREGVRDGEIPGRNLADVVMAIVRQNPAAPFTVSNVARAARITPNHFSTAFHRYAGKTFMEFLTEQRIERAKHLLKDPRLNVGDVALQSGFSDVNYFSRRFKHVVGQCPSDWRSGDACG